MRGREHCLRPLLAALLVLALIGRCEAQCSLQGASTPIEVVTVVDGDTLALKGGARLRVIGVNSPELRHGDGADEPLAAAARGAAQRFVARGRAAGLLMQSGVERSDRYGRLLGHVFLADGSGSLAAALIAEGLAWRVAIPPNLAYQECLSQAELSARVQRLGVWSDAYRHQQERAALRAGFQVIKARVVGVRFGESWWVDTDAGFTGRVMRSDQSGFARDQVAQWVGDEVEMRGWMYRRADGAAGRAAWVLLLRHPSALRSGG